LFRSEDTPDISRDHFAEEEDLPRLGTNPPSPGEDGLYEGWIDGLMAQASGE